MMEGIVPVFSTGNGIHHAMKNDLQPYYSVPENRSRLYSLPDIFSPGLSASRLLWAWSAHTYAEQHPNPWYPMASFSQYWHFFLSMSGHTMACTDIRFSIQRDKGAWKASIILCFLINHCGLRQNQCDYIENL